LHENAVRIDHEGAVEIAVRCFRHAWRHDEFNAFGFQFFVYFRKILDPKSEVVNANLIEFDRFAADRLVVVF
jgi:hypothetical protein